MIKKQTRTRCLFCNNNVNSGEHVFSEWMHDILPRAPTSMTRRMLPQGKSGSSLITERYKDKQGPTFNQKLRRVCSDCNNIWMSGIETDVKPILSPMILGEQIELDEEDQRKLACWITLKTIIIDSYQPQSSAISQEQRDLFSSLKSPPPNWLISIARNSGTRWRSSWSHRSYSLEKLPTFVRPERANLQATTIGLGQLVVHSFSAPNDFVHSRMAWAMEPFTRLWPLPSKALRWPQPNGLSDYEIDVLANVIRLTQPTL